MTTKIEWTRGADGSAGQTWNPTLGCTKVGDPDEDGCSRCYAIGVAHRAMQPAHEGLTIQQLGARPDWSGVVRCLPERLNVPLRRKKPTTYFVDSMSDLFHPEVPTEFIGSVWNTMGLASQHTFQILSKRRNGWRRDKYSFRADHVRVTPASLRFLSLEPLLGPLPSLDLTDIDWVIVGAESGRGARPMGLGWVREIRDRCVERGTPFFFKQAATDKGRKLPLPELDGKVWDQMPARPA